MSMAQLSDCTSSGRPGLKWSIIIAVLLLWVRTCAASMFIDKPTSASCAQNLYGTSSLAGYELVYQPVDDHYIPRGIHQAEFNYSCMEDAYPSQILPSSQAKIIGTYEKGFIMAFPKMASELRFFLKSLAKLGWSYYETDRYALVKDKAHIPDGEMDSIPASGMYALALSAAQAEHLVSRDEAIRVLGKIYNTISNEAVIPRAYGVLPHFVRWHGNKYVSLSEYSTVDTALYYHSMLIASGILGQSDIVAGLKKEIKKIEFEALTIKSGPDKGFITMGIDRDGKTIFRDRAWRHWGGETALVLLLAKMSGYARGFPVSTDQESAGARGNVFDGRGFIAEIQSLFYPQFDSVQPDKLTGQDWLKARRRLLHDQMHSTITNFPGSKAAEYNLYGYSCGEVNNTFAAGCSDYCENGIKDEKNRFIKPRPVIFPHYMLDVIPSI